MHDTKCKICGDGSVIERNDAEEFTHNGVTESLIIKGYECDNCFSSFTTPAQAKANKRAVMAFKRKADGLLSGSEVKRLREILGITQAEAAKYFGGGPVAFSKYESDDVIQSEAMDKLLRAACAVPGVIGFLKAHAEGQYKSFDAISHGNYRPRVNIHIESTNQLHELLTKHHSGTKVWQHETRVIDWNNLLTSSRDITGYIKDVLSRTKRNTGYTTLDKMLSGTASQEAIVESKGYQFSGKYSTNAPSWNRSPCLPHH